MKHDKLSIISGVLLALIAAFAFALSFDSIRLLAIDNGVRPQLAWIVPIIVDLAMIVFSFARLRAVLANQRTWWVWGLIVGFTAVSVAFNIAHSNHRVWGIIIAALAPLALFASFETLMSQLHQDVQGGVDALARHWRGRAKVVLGIARDWRQAARDWQGKVERLQDDYAVLLSRADNLQGQISELKTARAENTKLKNDNGRLQGELAMMKNAYEAWRHINEPHQVAARYNVGEFSNLEDAASIAGVSASTISRLAKSMNGASK